MSKRNHIDLSNEETGERADPVLEKFSLDVSPLRVKVEMAAHPQSRTGSAFAYTLMFASALGFGGGVTYMARWAGLHPVTSGIVGGIALLVALGMMYKLCLPRVSDAGRLGRKQQGHGTRRDRR